MAITIDGASTTITLESGVATVSAVDIYSDWKEWVALSDNAKFLPAFRVIGGDPIGTGIFAGSYFFLQNQNGWRIKPPEEEIQITLSGNLFGESTVQPVFVPTTGNFDTTVNLQTSSLTQQVTTSGSALTAADIATAVRQEIATELAEITKAKKYISNRLTVNAGTYTVFEDDGSTEFESGTTNSPDGTRTPS